MRRHTHPHALLNVEALEERRVLSTLLSFPVVIAPVLQSSTVPVHESTEATNPASGALPGNLVVPLLSTGPVISFIPASVSQPLTRFVALELFETPNGSFPGSLFVFQPVSSPVSLPEAPTIINIPSVPSVNVPGNNLPGVPVVNPQLPAQPPPIVNGGNPGVGPTISPTPGPSAAPAATATATPQTIGLLAFPLIPTYPVGASYVAPQTVAPVANGILPLVNRTTQLQDNLGFYWLPATDETLETPDELERQWNEPTPPADDDPAPPPAPQAPASQAPSPPADADMSWHEMPGAVRARAIEDLLRQADEIRPTEIMANDGWTYGLVAAGLLGTLAPELSGSSNGKTKSRKVRLTGAVGA
jgi:hypothetical protein